ncbi:MAG: thioredoxin family protein [Candidatus Micrarchaeota archaeon]
MELKPNNPLLLGAAVLIIFLAIAYVESTKAQMKNEFVGQLDGDNATKQGLFPKAPELSGIEGYINAPEGFRLSDIRGKVVLVDFWTYSCINCIRTLPYLTAWDEKYRDDGLVIVGVHTPEFEFEKEYANVLAAVEKHGIKYPVVLDNGFSTWRAYNNRFWPHKYLIDADGFIRYDHIGEGAYGETEEMIQKLLAERDAKVEMGGLVSENITEETPTQATTPEKYLGYSFALPRGQNIGNAGGLKPGETADYSLPASYQPHVVYLDGSWKSEPEYVELASETGKVVLKYRARNVNIVAEGDSTLSITLDGSVPEGALGGDVKIAGGKATAGVSEERLYSIVEDEGYSEKTLEMDVSGKGFRLYTFTFG